MVKISNFHKTYCKELLPQCNGKAETEKPCLQIAREDGTPLVFSAIPKELRCKKDTFESEPTYLPYPPLATQTEFNIAIVDCAEYEEAIPDRDQRLVCLVGNSEESGIQTLNI